MVERQAPCVQRMPLELDRPQRAWPERVSLFSDERVAAQPRLDADLIAPAALEPHFDQRGVFVPLEDPVIRDRFLRIRIARMGFFLDQRLLVPYKMIAPLAGRGRRMSLHHRQVHAIRLPPLELRLQSRLRFGVLREHDEPRRVLVDPMNDQRTALARWTQVALHLVVHRWRRTLAFQRHRQKARGLVDDNQRGVFEQDFDVAGGLRSRPRRLRAARAVHPDPHAIAVLEPARRRIAPRFVVVDEDLAARQRRQGFRARSKPLRRREEFVEASARLLRLDRPFVGCHPPSYVTIGGSSNPLWPGSTASFMISVSGVSMRFGSKVLFEDVTTTFSTGRRYGLTGPNGAGKSTFMKLLTGESQPQSGTVTRPEKLGVLRQDQFAFDEFRVIDTVIMGNQRLWKALEEREHLYAVTDMTDAQGMRLAELEGVVGEEDGYTAESDAAVLLDGLDIPEPLHHRKMSALQGGQKVRVLLAQALFGGPQALLLDEPTNHLDLESIHWLREFLVRYGGTLIVISHDRHFLNGICTHIADIDYQTIITYTGGYDDMVLAKMQIRSKVESDNAQREKKIAQLNDFIARFSAGTRASQVQARRKEVERLQTTELARSNIQRPYIKFTLARPSGRMAMEIKEVSKGFENHPVIEDFDAIVNRGEKIVIVGRNGVGKTTLLKALLSDAPGAIGASPKDIDSGSDDD